MRDDDPSMLSKEQLARRGLEGSVPKRITKERQLLIDLLQEIDTSDVPEDLGNRLKDFVAEVQGCHYCGKPAKYLCDFVLEYSATADGPMPSREDDPDSHKFTQWLLNPKEVHLVTCDRPLCEEHRTQKGTIFCCGELGSIGSVDCCPGHANVPSGRKPPFNPVRPRRGKAC